ncbi:hypothetical protein EVAR_45485_1 [Eumeta japonica]|uniref:Uncharacterized protein n=1 Tax=Eumeta variegata TaxID=151549 RepID=A0A4C1WGJ6_EUMVA|nr:hypothetical protein EVAR_45485_1 [Eumeta japonica]
MVTPAEATAGIRDLDTARYGELIYLDAWLLTRVISLVLAFPRAPPAPAPPLLPSPVLPAALHVSAHAAFSPVVYLRILVPSKC